MMATLVGRRLRKRPSRVPGMYLEYYQEPGENGMFPLKVVILQAFHADRMRGLSLEKGLPEPRVPVRFPYFPQGRTRQVPERHDRALAFKSTCCKDGTGVHVPPGGDMGYRCRSRSAFDLRGGRVKRRKIECHAFFFRDEFRLADQVKVVHDGIRVTRIVQNL